MNIIIKPLKHLSLISFNITLVFVSSALAACIDSGQPVCTSTTSCYERLSISNNSTIEVFRNNSLDQVHCNVTHAVIVIHGRDRNPADYFSYTMSAATLANRSKNSLIISPYFREQDDARVPTDLYWNRAAGSASSFDWAMGGDAYAPEKLSSFRTVDAIIKSIASSGKFPNLKSIVVAGHSAGGQLVQRYAETGNFNNQGLTQQLFYVPANPSTYAYLNNNRPVSGSLTSFAVPDSTGCSSYNNWGYGLLKPNIYVSSLTSTQITEQYIARKVTYLLGDADTSTDGMDVTCYANFQGTNRFKRGTAHFNFMNKYFSGHKHTKSVVPGVGHSGSKMFKSSQGVAALFPAL